MYASFPIPRPAVHTARPAVPAPPAARRTSRARDFGVGYGSSSGYASRGRYSSSSVASRFRLS